MNSMRHGILPLYKPAGFTSHDCVNKLRRILRIKRIGHTGTLDPNVTGVLPICVGQATRLAEYLLELPKEYEGEFILGRSTDTADADGNVTAEKIILPGMISKEQIKEVFREFTGELAQVPPMYSAVKIKGKRLHELAREGREVERQPRQVHIYQLDLLHMQSHSGLVAISFRVSCSKGTYIRVLCEDIGKRLGYPAYMSRLIRTKSGPYRLDDCRTFDEIEKKAVAGEWEELIFAPDTALIHFPHLDLNEEETKYVLNGRKIPVQIQRLETDQISKVRLYDPTGKFIALYHLENEEQLTDTVLLTAEKVFKEWEDII